MLVMTALIFVKSGHYTRERKFIARDLRNSDLETDSNSAEEAAWNVHKRGVRLKTH